MPEPVVALVGLRALGRDLDRATGDRGPVNAMLRQAGLQAAQPVADVARSAVPTVSGTLAGDVRANATRSGATVRMGRARINYAGWVEFGGRRRRPHDSEREYLPNGRYLFPAARQLAATVPALYSDALEAAFNNLDWTNSTTDGGAVHD
jgi:hypothetical protein